jgi:glutaredoxin 3
MNEPVKLYTKTHCPNCVRAKDFLSARNVAFTSVNIETDPQAMQELIALGVLSVPVVKVGERWARGSNLDEVAALLDGKEKP